MEKDADSVRNDFRTAFWQLFSKQGMTGLTAARLCERAGYSRSSFYRHFQSTYDLLDELEERALPYREMGQLLQRVDTIGMAEFRQAFLDYFNRDTDVVVALCRHDTGNRFSNKFSETIEPAFRAVIDRTFDINDTVADSLAKYITQAKVALFLYWARTNRAFRIESLLRVTDGIFEAGFWDLVDKSKRLPDGTMPRRLSLDELYEQREWLVRS